MYTPMPFGEYVKLANIKDDYYPYAKLGLQIFKINIQIAKGIVGILLIVALLYGMQYAVYRQLKTSQYHDINQQSSSQVEQQVTKPDVQSDVQPDVQPENHSQLITPSNEAANELLNNVSSNEGLFNPSKEESITNEDIFGNVTLEQSNTFIPDLSSFSFSATSILDKIDTWLHNSIVFVATILPILLLISIVGWITYCVIVLKRWAAYERDCLKNDFKAYTLRNKIITSARINDTVKAAKRKVSEEGKREGQGVSYQSRDELQAAKSLKRFQVYVNTRQSLNTDEIQQRYSIEFDIPPIDIAREHLLKLIDRINTIATNCEKGKVKFGDKVLSEDGSKASFFDSIPVKNKYIRKNVEIVVNSGPSQYTFPLSLFEDRRDEIKRIKESAQQWGLRSAESLDMFYSTTEANVKRLSFTVGATNALFVYELSFSINLSNVNSQQETIDKLFKTKGTTINIVNGQLHVTIPLPDNLKAPLDVASMYRAIFGDDVPSSEKVVL